MGLQLPSFYKREEAMSENFKFTNYSEVNEEALRYINQYGFKPAGLSNARVGVLGIDFQGSFVWRPPVGSLFVAGSDGLGAVLDTARFSEFLYRNAYNIDYLFDSLDSHPGVTVFFQSAIVYAADERPIEVWATVTADRFESGELVASPAFVAVANEWLGHNMWNRKITTEYLAHYDRKLEETGRSPHRIWPVHTPMGGDGHQLANNIMQATNFHSILRGVNPRFIEKGMNPLTENLSIFQQEVMILQSGRPIPGASFNEKLMREILALDAGFFGGEAGSHCVLWTVQDMIRYVYAHYDTWTARSILSKFYILEDCISPVVAKLPDGTVLEDHTLAQIAAFADFRDHGINIVKSTTPMEDMPGIAGQIAQSRLVAA